LSVDDLSIAPAPAATPLRAYLDLDLAYDAKVATDLSSRVEREAKRGSLSLTGDGDAGAISAHLTPEMQSWLGTHIGGKRQAALTAIEAAARQIRGDGNTEGIVAEIEEDRLKRESTQRLSDETHRFYDRHKDSVDQLNKLQGEYDAHRADLGDRDAIVPSRWVEWGLPLLVAVPEGFMNYGSFVALAGLGVAGLGLTIVAGIAIGVASWLAGRFWKAWQFYMRADDDDQQQRGLRMIGLASVLLTVALGFVGYARFKTVAERAMELNILGLPAPNPVIATLLLLMGNLLVFFIGAAITYILHDEDPLFAERAAKLATCRSRFDSAKRREFDRKVTDITKGHHQKVERMRLRAEKMRRKSEYDAVVEDMGRLSAKDHEVLGLLQSYRTHLIHAIEERDPTFRINASTRERQTGTASGTIGLAEFATLPLHLYRGVR